MSKNEHKEYIVNNEQGMYNLVVDLLSNLKLKSKTIKSNKATVLALSGELGTGKTTFTKALAKELGITEHITSPTFVIQKSYKVSQTAKQGFAVERLVHIDAYRLEGADDMKTLDFANTLAAAGTLVVIEWAENIVSALPNSTININFKHIDETTRKVVIDGILG